MLGKEGTERAKVFLLDGVHNGHYEIVADEPAGRRLAVPSGELATAI